MVENPNWQEADQLAIYKHERGVERGAIENNTSLWSEWDLNLQSQDFKFGTLTTQPESHTSSLYVYCTCKPVYVVSHMFGSISKAIILGKL